MLKHNFENDSDSDRVSINSIVSENLNFDSDNEAPEDKCAQVDKIIKNHVVKEIISPGKGLSKPAKFDFIIVKYKCYFQSLNHFKNEKIFYNLIDRTDTEYKGYLQKLKFPTGIVKAIQFMRAGEKSRIILRPKYGFKKIKEEALQEFFDGSLNDIIAQYNQENPDYSKENFIKDLKTKTLIYQIQLIDFVKIYDISGYQNMMKQIIVQGEGLVKPFENNLIALNYKIFINNILFKRIDNHVEYLNENNFTEGEITIIKSMKKNELSRIDIKYDYFLDCFAGKSHLFNLKEFESFLISNLHNNSDIKISKDQTAVDHQHANITENVMLEPISAYFTDSAILKNPELENSNNRSFKEAIRARIIYEVELLKIKNNKSFSNFKNIPYEKLTLCKGIGNICPWDRSLLKFLMKIKINEKEVYCDNFEELLKPNVIDFAKKIKDIKKIIKTKPNYLNNIQYIVDGLIKDKILIDSEVYDPINRNLPDLIYETLKTMKILQVENLKFTIPQTKHKPKNEFIKLKNLEMNLNNSEEYKDKDVYYDVTLCLLNFQENFSIFNKNVILLSEEEKYQKLLSYKSEANYFFSKEIFTKSKKINKWLANEYTKYINVDKSKTSELLVRNKDDFVKPEIKFTFFEAIEANKELTIENNFEYERKVYYEMKKIFSNLILIYFKSEKFKKCEEYINLFYHIFRHENLFSNNIDKNFAVDEIYEKVMFLESKYLFKLLKFNECKAVISRLLSLYHQQLDLHKPKVFEESSNAFVNSKDAIEQRYQSYIKEYQSVLSAIEKTENEKILFIKKMFKY